jgi:predicted type IV restriction endonuclease
MQPHTRHDPVFVILALFVVNSLFLPQRTQRAQRKTGFFILSAGRPVRTPAMIRSL